MSDKRLFKVMFVCIGNSCRGPMAEGCARANHSDIIEPSSRGIGPAPIVQPSTISAMLEKDISIKDLSPTSISDSEWESVDLVVNMSGAGVLEFLPGFKGGNLIWEVADPMGQPLEVYRQSRDRIEKLVDRLAATLRKPRPAAEAED